MNLKSADRPKPTAVNITEVNINTPLSVTRRKISLRRGPRAITLSVFQHVPVWGSV